MSELKTKPNDLNVNEFVNSIEPKWKREDSKTLLYLIERVSGEKPKIWSPSIVGYGSYHYKYESGRE